jgi:hypothetical protein
MRKLGNFGYQALRRHWNVGGFTPSRYVAVMQGVHTRGDDYREYQRTTPLLFPWVPKSTSSVRSLS